MWGNRKVETGAPAAAVPLSPQTQETDPKNPISASLEANMTTESVRPTTTVHTGIANRLGAGLHVKGEITGREDLHVDGSLEGSIRLENGKLTVGVGAKLIAEIVASEIVVYGSVTGNLHARHRIEIKKDGSIVGDLTTARIMIEDGANFKGAIEIEQKAAEAKGSEATEYSQAARVGS